NRRVTTWVGAEAAQLALGEGEAAPAETHALAKPGDGLRQLEGVVARHSQEMESETLRRLRTDRRQPAQLVDEALDRPLERTGQSDSSRSPPRSPRPRADRSRPPGSAGAIAVAFSSASRMPSLTAATTRSWSISTSSGSITSGSMSIDTSSLVPVTTTLTMPPPAVASSLSSARDS